MSAGANSGTLLSRESKVRELCNIESPGIGPVQSTIEDSGSQDESARNVRTCKCSVISVFIAGLGNMV